MAGRRIPVTDYREMIRRFKLGISNRSIAKELGLSRNTVACWKFFSAKRGWLEREKPIPSLEEINQALKEIQQVKTPGPLSQVAGFQDIVKDLCGRGVKIQVIWQILRDNHGFQGSYSSVRRFVRKLEPAQPEPCVRIETEPGDEAQVDFGYAGRLLDPVTGELRKAWVFVMTLSFSRHQYAEIVFDQKVETWIFLHIKAFEFFGGVTKRVVIDNLKAAITKACFHDPEVQRSYRELAEHYGFLISPCRIATPRHKGKVESGVKYIKNNALAGRDFKDVRDANGHLLAWVMGTAGNRIHGTTRRRPLELFDEIEKARLLPLPPSRYEPAVWKQVKLHPDCHVVFDYSYYSAPFRLVGRQLILRATAFKVEMYHEFEHVATHQRALARGSRVTEKNHLPPHKVQGLMPAPGRVMEKAAAVGPFTAEAVNLMLGDRPLDRLRGAMGVVSLALKHGAGRLELACKRALSFDDVRYRTIRNILRNGLEALPLPEEEFARSPLPKTSFYARKPSDFLATR